MEKSNNVRKYILLRITYYKTLSMRDEVILSIPEKQNETPDDAKQTPFSFMRK